MRALRMHKWGLFFGAVVLTGCASLTGSTEENGVRKQITDDNRVVSREDSGIRKRLMILPFLDAAEMRGPELREEARRDFVRELNRGGSVIALDSSELKVDISKHLRGGEYDLAAIAKPAAQLGVHAVLEGKILSIYVKRTADPVGVFRQVKSRFEAQARVRIYTARAAKEIFNTVKTITLEEANVRVGEKVDSDRFLTNNPELLKKLVQEAFLDFTPQIVAALSQTGWEGRVAMVNGDRIFINVGRVSGVQVGDILKVSEEGDEIYDPQTGNYIGKTPGRMKGTLEVVSYFGQDGAIAIIHSGAGFRENDRVEMY